MWEQEKITVGIRSVIPLFTSINKVYFSWKSSKIFISLNIWYKNYEHNGKEVNLLIIGIRPVQHDRVEITLTCNNELIANVTCKQIVKSSDGHTATYQFIKLSLEE